MYSIELKSQARKFIRKQPKNVQKQILDQIEKLGSGPFPPGSIRLHADPNLHRIRAGDYRVIYHVEHQEKHIVITKVGHRKDVYDSL